MDQGSKERHWLGDLGRFGTLIARYSFRETNCCKGLQAQADDVIVY